MTNEERRQLVTDNLKIPQRVFRRFYNYSNGHAEDLIQEGYVALLECTQRYEPQTEHQTFYWYSYRRIHGKMQDYLRKLVGWREGTKHTVRIHAASDKIEAYSAANAKDPATEVARFIDVDRALDALKPAFRTSVVSRYFHDKEVSQMARERGVSGGAESQRLSFALKQLRTSLADYAHHKEPAA